MALARDQVNFYHNNDYILLEQIIPINALTRLRDRISDFIEVSNSVSHASVWDRLNLSKDGVPVKAESF